MVVMKIQQLKSFFLISILVLWQAFVFAQHTPNCGQAQVMDKWFQQHPEAKGKLIQSYTELNAHGGEATSTRSGKMYTIPVVFHVLHLGGPENISEAQIQSQVDILNRDYQKRNADTTDVVAAFKNNIANVGFEFKLAKIDPDGKCTNGIVRHYTSKTNWDAYFIPDFTFSWPTDRYLNIYVTKTINVAPAYTFLPGTGIPDYADAIVCIHNVCGSIGTSNVSNSRAVTHEVAHWFGIPHIWGVSNLPGVACGDDFVDDTPITKGFTICNTAGSNVCNPAIFENVQNYMDYAPCKIMFTNGQAARMRQIIESGINNRNRLVSAVNLKATGVLEESPCITRANFFSKNDIACQGSMVNFVSLSKFGGQQGNLSWKFEGGSPSTASDSLVTVTYTDTGTFNISLIASGVNGTDTLVGKIRIVDGAKGQKLPYIVDFEEDILSSKVSSYNQQEDFVAWQHNKQVGANGTGKSVYLNGIEQTNTYGNRDFLYTNFLDCSNTTNLKLSYYYAYAKKVQSQSDTFRIEFSLDCGATWRQISGVPSMTAMANATGGITEDVFAPSTTQWQKTNIPSAFLSQLNYKPSVQLRFLFRSDYNVDGSNNLYLDEINLTGDINTSNSDLRFEHLLSIIPNPTSGATRLELLADQATPTAVNLFDLTGRWLSKILPSEVTNEKAIFNLNEDQSIRPGMYLVKVDIAGYATLVEKLIILQH